MMVMNIDVLVYLRDFSPADYPVKTSWSKHIDADQAQELLDVGICFGIQLAFSHTFNMVLQ